MALTFKRDTRRWISVYRDGRFAGVLRHVRARPVGGALCMKPMVWSGVVCGRTFRAWTLRAAKAMACELAS